LAFSVNVPKTILRAGMRAFQAPPIAVNPLCFHCVCYNPALRAGRDERLTASGTGAHRHLRFGWWSLCIFGALGLTLELLHGFKVRAYLDVNNETRRLMWTLAHAHGTLLGLVHLAFAVSLPFLRLDAGRLRLASTSLLCASLLLPGGFFLAGIRFYAGDPGLGIALVPVGAALLLLTAGLAATSVGGVEDSGTQGRQGPARKV
jgi:hypothetical protein